MSIRRKSYGFKALGKPDAAGTFEAIVSVFGNVDDVGDRVMPGAFTNTIAAKNGVFPVVWTHAWGVVPVGKTILAEERPEGLYVKGQLLIDDHDVARQLYAAFKSGVPLEFSFAYDIVKSTFVTEGDAEVLELNELDVLEVGPCLIGANRETRLLGVKSGDQPVTEALITAQVETAAKTLGLVTSSDVEALVQAALDSSNSEGQDGPQSPPSGGPEPDDADTGKPEWTGEQVAEVARYLATPA